MVWALGVLLDLSRSLSRWRVQWDDDAGVCWKRGGGVQDLEKTEGTEQLDNSSNNNNSTCMDLVFGSIHQRTAAAARHSFVFYWFREERSWGLVG